MILIGAESSQSYMYRIHPDGCTTVEDGKVPDLFPTALPELQCGEEDGDHDWLLFRGSGLRFSPSQARFEFGTRQQAIHDP
jgi:hypothetical protein